MMCRHACCVVLYTCQQGSHVYKDQFDENGKNCSFNFSVDIFSVFPIIPLYYPYLPSSHFTQTHQTRPWPSSFPPKPSPYSPLQDHHHLRRSTLEKIMFWSQISLFVKVTSFNFVFHSLLFVSPFFVYVFCDFRFLFLGIRFQL